MKYRGWLKGLSRTKPLNGVEKLNLPQAVQKRLDARRARTEELWVASGGLSNEGVQRNAADEGFSTACKYVISYLKESNEKVVEILRDL